MPLLITPRSHLYNLPSQAVAFLQTRGAGRAAPFKEVWELPPQLPAAMSDLHGPLAGDEPIGASAAFFAFRPGRPAKGPSRLVRRGSRPSRSVLVIAGAGVDGPCVLLAAFGWPAGASAEALQREPWDARDEPEHRAACDFWREHALSTLMAPRVDQRLARQFWEARYPPPRVFSEEQR